MAWRDHRWRRSLFRPSQQQYRCCYRRKAALRWADGLLSVLKNGKRFVPISGKMMIFLLSFRQVSKASICSGINISGYPDPLQLEKELRPYDVRRNTSSMSPLTTHSCESHITLIRSIILCILAPAPWIVHSGVMFRSSFISSTTA